MAIPIWGYIGGGALLMGAISGWTVRDWKADSDELSAQENAEEVRKEAEARWFAESQFYQDQIFELSQRSSTFRETIRTEFRDVEVPAECAVPVNVASVLDNAVRTANAAVSGGSIEAVPTDPDSADPVD